MINKKKINNNRTQSDDCREVTLRKAQTRTAREHGENKVPDAVPIELHAV